MNRIYRLVWNHFTQSLVAVAECARGRGKRPGSGLAGGAVVATAAVAAVLATGAAAQGGPPPAQLPTGAQVVGGAGSVSTQGQSLIVQQSSNRLAMNWDSFNIGANNRVEFVMPSSASVALNRVVGMDASVIQGQLTANGNVFLVNPNGVLFSRSAQVDVGGLVASTLDLSAQDFMAGRTVFSGSSRASVVNQGTLRAAEGGAIALIAGRIVNEGTLSAPRGQVGLGAGDKVTLDLGGPTLLQVENRTLETLIESGGVIRADGGRIQVTSRAADELTRSVINHTGVIEAQSLGTGADGQVVLFAVGGTLNLSGSVKAEGGFVETSGKFFNTLAGARVQARNWLIDPVNVVIDSTLAGSIQTALGSGNVTVTTDGACTNVTCPGSGTEGNITVSAPLSWSANKLTLHADNNIAVNANIEVTGTGSVFMKFGQATADGAGSSYSVGSGVSFKIPLPTGIRPATSAFAWKKGSAGTDTDLVLNNGFVAFGSTVSSNASQLTAHNTSAVTGQGLLSQPLYFDNTTSGGNRYYKLTYSNFPLSLQVGTGTGGSRWNGNTTFATASSDQEVSDYGVRPGGYLEISGYKPGTGTGPGGGPKGSGVIESVVPITFGGDGGTVNAQVTNRFELGESNSFTKITTTVTATGGALSNVALWVGTNDDYIGSTDGPVKTVGNINSSGAFVANTADGQAANALRVDQYSNGTGASALFYSTTTGARAVISDDRGFDGDGVPGKNPSQAPFRIVGDDSYALYANLGTLGSGASGSFTFYYAAANAANIENVTNSVAGVTPTSTPVNYTLAPLSGTYTYKGTPYTLASLWSAGTIFGNTYSAWVAGTDYAFQSGGSPVTGFTNAGTYSNISVNVLKSGFTTAGSGNTNGSLTIAPAPLTITATNASTTYNGVAYSGGNGVGYSGFVNGETASVLSGTLTYVGSSQGAINAGNYVITPSGLTSSNYTVTNASGALTVAARPITVAADAKSKTYGDTDPALTWSVTSGSLVGSDTLTGALSRATGSNVGSYAIDASALANTNYSITPTNGLFTINARPITVAADDKKKTYGEADPALTWSVIAGSLVGSDSLMGAVTRAPGIRVGTYAIDLSTLSNPNYSITRQDGTLTVVPPVPTPGQTANATVPVSQPMVAWSGNQAPMTTRGGLALSAGNTGSVSLNTVVMGVQTQSQGGLVPELARLPLKAPTADELMQMARR